MPRRQPARYLPATHEPRLARAAHRAGGIYYTPPEIARQIVELTLVPLCQPGVVRILDPACGAGELLIAARDSIRHGEGCQPALFGIDIDPAAVAQAQQRLGSELNRCGCIQMGDALADELHLAGSFDAVIGNPPYVNIRELARRHSPEYVAALRERFQTARGHFDLYVLFIERALQWLRPGGRCGVIVPNKWATLDYARPCRELLLKQATLDDIVDLSAHRVFQRAKVYPHLIVFTKQPPVPSAAVRVDGQRLVLQRMLSPAAISLGPELDVESLAATQPLGSLCRLSCGTPGYAAAKIAALLADGESAPSPALPFITSGNIDRYRFRTGNVRYLGRSWRDPRLSLAATGLTPRQRELFASPKLVIAGLTRRLEAAWDSQGLALGVQVFAATEFQVDSHYLLALLNSKLLTFLFHNRFAAKRLNCGYLSVNKGQLARLPIVVPSPGKCAELQRSERLTQLAIALSADRAPLPVALEVEIDQLVYELYRLSSRQVAEVEAHFAELDRRYRPAA